MASGDVETKATQQTSGSTDPNVQATTSLLAQKLGGLAQNVPPAYGQSLYAGVGPTTKNAWAQGTGVANNLLNTGGLTGSQSGAVGGLNKVNAGYADLAGAYDQSAPGYATMRQSALDDAITGVTAGQLGSGLLGSRSYIQDATKAGVNAIAPMDYQNFQNGINNRYHSLDSQRGIYDDVFGMGQQGLGNQSAALAQLGAIGGAQDADMAAQRQGEADLYTRQTQAPLQWYQGVTSAANGNAAVSGQQQSSSTQIPWWMAGLGAVSTGAGLLGSF